MTKNEFIKRYNEDDFMKQKELDEIERENIKLKEQIKELVELGTDQYVTEKIVRLEKENEELKTRIKEITHYIPKLGKL